MRLPQPRWPLLTPCQGFVGGNAWLLLGVPAPHPPRQQGLVLTWHRQPAGAQRPPPGGRSAGGGRTRQRAAGTGQPPAAQTAYARDPTGSAPGQGLPQLPAFSQTSLGHFQLGPPPPKPAPAGPHRTDPSLQAAARTTQGGGSSVASAPTTTAMRMYLEHVALSPHLQNWAPGPLPHTGAAEPCQPHPTEPQPPGTRGGCHLVSGSILTMRCLFLMRSQRSSSRWEATCSTRQAMPAGAVGAALSSSR